MTTVLGASKNLMFKQCRRKYKYRFLDKLPQKDWPFSLFGSYVHKVLEVWVQNLITGLHTKEAAKQAYTIAIKEFGGRITPEDLMLAGELIQNYMRDYLAGDVCTLCTEKKFSFALDRDFVVHGVIDRIDETGEGTLEVIDYKTGKSAEHLYTDQLLIYTLATKEQFGYDKSIAASYILLKLSNKKVTYCFTDNELAEGKQRLLKEGRSIRDERRWDPTPSYLCNYCDYFLVCHRECDYWADW